MVLTLFGALPIVVTRQWVFRSDLRMVQRPFRGSLPSRALLKNVGGPLDMGSLSWTCLGEGELGLWHEGFSSSVRQDVRRRFTLKGLLVHGEAG